MKIYFLKQKALDTLEKDIAENIEKYQGTEQWAENGNYLWQEGMDTILGKPVYISEFMPSSATGKKVIAFGDFNYYWILNRRPLAVRALKEKFELYD